jgi:hypothetical protein
MSEYLVYGLMGVLVYRCMCVLVFGLIGGI